MVKKRLTHRYYSAKAASGETVEYRLPRRGKLIGADLAAWNHLLALAGDYRRIIAADLPGSVREA